MFVALTLFACSVELITEQPKFKNNTQPVVSTDGELVEEENFNKIRDERKKVLYVLVGTVQAKMVSSRLFLVRMVPGLC